MSTALPAAATTAADHEISPSVCPATAPPTADELAAAVLVLAGAALTAVAAR